MVRKLTAAVALTATLLAACSKAPEPAAVANACRRRPTAAPAATALPRSPAPADAQLYIVSPKDGEPSPVPVTVVFGLSGMGVAPAGVQFENTGHHHLLIDTDLPADLSMPLPADDKHVHFGKGQTADRR